MLDPVSKLQGIGDRFAGLPLPIQLEGLTEWLEELFAVGRLRRVEVAAEQRCAIEALEELEERVPALG